ncbi:hypothetical protein HDE_07329 [Halotydeus destructor]|nr:hypothetical protein HDE_07329 [Halotydeus destructor]
MRRALAPLMLTTLVVTTLVVTVTPKPQDQDMYNLYSGEDASQVLQAAFAHAGISLGDGIGPMSHFMPTKRPTIWQSSAAKLRNLKLPSLPTFGRRKVSHMPMLLPIMGTLPRPAKDDQAEQMQHFVNHLQSGQYLTQPSLVGKNLLSVPANHHEKKHEVESVNNYQIWSTPSFAPNIVKPASTTPTPMVSEAYKRLPLSVTRPRSVQHNYNHDNWTPTRYGATLKPSSLESASSSLVPSASILTSSNVVNLTDALSPLSYLQSTKRVSNYWDKFKQSPSLMSNQFEGWHVTNNNITATTIEDLLRFHPIKYEKETANKIMPINPVTLLDQISRESSNRKTADCKNKDLGWCDYGDNYPTHLVMAVIKECRDIIDRMYVEVPQNLADFDDFVPFAPSSNATSLGRERANQATWSWAGYRSKTSALCDADKKFVRPSVAQDITGRWFVIVQSSLYHQQVPTDMCRNPGGICNNIGECGTHARCVQKFHTQLLISIDLDKENDCPSMRLYRFPSGCVCDNSQSYQ